MCKRHNFFILISLAVFFVFQTQPIYSQTEKGVKIADVEMRADIGENNSIIGFWRHPNRAAWIHISEDKRAYQCRIGNDNLVYSALGTLENDKRIVWRKYWGTDEFKIKKGVLYLKGADENFSLVRVDEISSYSCRTPLGNFITNPELKLPDVLSDGPGSGFGTGRGTGDGMGQGSGFGTGRGTGGGMGTGYGSGTGSGVGDGTGTKPPLKKGVTRGVQIISKPTPIYTDSARNNNVQGVVRLRVTFLADGTIGSIRVVKGLPEGLTAAAVAAARMIKFNPAMRNGQPYTVSRVLEFSFTIY